MFIVLQTAIGKPVGKVEQQKKGKTKAGEILSKIGSIFEKKPKAINTPRYQKKGGSVSAKMKSKSKKK